MFTKQTCFHKASHVLILLFGFFVGFTSLHFTLDLSLYGGHDYIHSYVMFDLFYEQLLHGEIYPRYLANANSNMGGYDFFFYQPLFYYLGSLIKLLTFNSISTALTLVLTNCVILALSGYSFYIFSRVFADHYISIIAALIYMSLPYHAFYDTAVRSAFSETLAYIFIPMLFYCVVKKSELSSTDILLFSGSYAGLILSHLPLAFITTIFIAIYSICLFALTRFHDMKFFTRECSKLAFAGALGAGLSALYLYPCLRLLHNVNTDHLWNAYFNFDDHYLFLKSAACYTFAPNRAECQSVLKIYYQVQLLLTLLITGLCAFSSFYRRYFFDKITQNDRINICLKYVFYVFIAFLILDISKPIWDMLPLLKKIQFSWRLLVFLDFFNAAILIFVLNAYKDCLNKWQKELMVLLICAYSALTFVNIALYQPAPFEIRPWIAKNVTTIEFIPHSTLNSKLKQEDFLNIGLEASPQIISGVATADITAVRSREFILHVTAAQESNILLKPFYSSLWHIYDGQEDKTDFYQFTESAPYGQMAITVPEGEHALTFRLDKTPEEKIGFLISLIALMIYLGLFLYNRYNRKKTA